LELDGESKKESIFDIPYRMIYGVVTHDAVFIYDTQQSAPLCMLGNLHFTSFTDLTWSPDGETVILSSQDGYCSVISFEPGELGEPCTSLSIPQPPTLPVSNLSLPSPPGHFALHPRPMELDPSTSGKVSAASVNPSAVLGTRARDEKDDENGERKKKKKRVALTQVA